MSVKTVRHLARQRLADVGGLAAGETVVVGVSGGADSVCLLDVLAHWQPALKVHVAHVHHGLRPQASAEADQVRALAGRYGLPFHLRQVHLAAHAPGLEERARQARYAALAEVAHAVGARTVAVAHTQNDQAETVLLHLLRGSGLAGLAGMALHAPFPTGDTALRLVRPLLAVSRAAVEAYCAAAGLPFVVDASNADPTFARNRVRHHLLPELATYNPQSAEHLARLADLARAEHTLAARWVTHLVAQHVQGEPPHLHIARHLWPTLDMAEQCALLRAAIHQLRPQTDTVTFEPVVQAARFARHAQPGQTCGLLAGLVLEVTYDALVIRPAQLGPYANHPQVADNGSLAIGWRLDVGPADVQPPDRWCAHVDAASLAAPLNVRAPRRGERVWVVGLPGPAKLSDLFNNHKIPQPARARWPLVVCGEAVVWIPGVRVAAPFAVSPHTAHRLAVRLMKE